MSAFAVFKFLEEDEDGEQEEIFDIGETRWIEDYDDDMIFSNKSFNFTDEVKTFWPNSVGLKKWNKGKRQLEDKRDKNMFNGPYKANVIRFGGEF